MQFVAWVKIEFCWRLMLASFGLQSDRGHETSRPHTLTRLQDDQREGWLDAEVTNRPNAKNVKSLVVLLLQPCL